MTTVRTLETALLGLCLLTAGCQNPVSTRDFYVLSAQRQGPAASQAGPEVLEVRRLGVDAAFASRELVYRRTEFGYDTDYYRQFLVPPAQMLTERTRDWLDRSGLFARVLCPGHLMDPTCVLEGHVLALYGDFRDAASPRAVLEIRFCAVGQKAGRDQVLLTRTYARSEPLKESKTEALIPALDLCLAQVLADLEQDLIKTLGNE